MMRGETRGVRVALFAAGAFLTIVLAIWQHAYTAALTRTEADLQEKVKTLRSTLETRRVEAAQASALLAQQVSDPTLRGFVEPTTAQVSEIAVTDLRPAGEIQVARASLGDRMMDALLPSAGARVRSGSN